MSRAVALIPARSGSTRIVDKNIRRLAGHPLIAYTISSAIQSNCFDEIICVTDSTHYADIAKWYGASVPALRPENTSGAATQDFLWLEWISDFINLRNTYDYFSILRPTSPFRSHLEINRAMSKITQHPECHSLRAISEVSQHPAKMWHKVPNSDIIYPLMPMNDGLHMLHSCQKPSLPVVYTQNASLEIARSDVIEKFKSISGTSVIGFESDGLNGFDINTQHDWMLCEALAALSPDLLPNVHVAPF